jgi:hypothetical protein
MYVRVARFEGVDPSRTDAMVEEMRGQMDAMRRGETPEGIPAEAVAALRDDITRGMSLLDREHDVSLFLAFADDEAAIRRVDAALIAMSPGARAAAAGSRWKLTRCCSTSRPDPEASPRGPLSHRSAAGVPSGSESPRSQATTFPTPELPRQGLPG